MLAGATRLYRFVADHPLTRDHKASAFARVVRWQVRSRLSREPVVPWIAGTRLIVRRGMHGMTGNLYAGFQEFAGMAFVMHLLRPGDLFADVGANVGSYTVLAGGVCRASVVAYEPEPAAAAVLQRNITLNALRATVHVAAASSHQGTAHLSDDRGAGNQVGDTGQPIRLVTLDQTAGSPLALKMDVEGHEARVLAGASRLLADPNLRAILIEDHSALRPVLDAGFELVGYDPFSRQLTPYTRGDALLVRDRPFIEERLTSAPKHLVAGRWL